MADGAATVPGLGEAPVDNAGVGAEPGVACATAEAKLLGMTVGLQAHSAITTTHAKATRRQRFDPLPGIAAVTG
jgi:hypothetical protein